MNTFEERPTANPRSWWRAVGRFKPRIDSYPEGEYGQQVHRNTDERDDAVGKRRDSNLHTKRVGREQLPVIPRSGRQRPFYGEWLDRHLRRLHEEAVLKTRFKKLRLLYVGVSLRVPTVLCTDRTDS